MTYLLYFQDYFLYAYMEQNLKIYDYDIILPYRRIDDVTYRVIPAQRTPSFI